MRAMGVTASRPSKKRPALRAFRTITPCIDWPPKHPPWPGGFWETRFRFRWRKRLQKQSSVWRRRAMSEIRNATQREAGKRIAIAILAIIAMIALLAAIYLAGPRRNGGDAPYASQAVRGVVCLDLDGDGKADAILGQKGTVFIPPNGKARVFPCPTAPREAVFRSGGWAGVDWAFWTSEQGK
jgi:hypothetical protein